MKKGDRVQVTDRYMRSACLKDRVYGTVKTNTGHGRIAIIKRGQKSPMYYNISCWEPTP